ncbi:DUF3617 domain-containing protein [Bradyrhizobium prioriisuperbiae]|uniref:DUF3617 domain-containing protein n=1 Tax=Bradyrhizobium prioriisuperbiae TaxID=2854389 RepID=UPI0028F05FA9|nr:DUF3617 family protein [Bradyrhizobium prioritasuperba]
MRSLLTHGAISAALICLALPATAHAGELELPTRKPGLWDMKMLSAESQKTPISMQQCTDEATDKVLMARINSQPVSAACSKRDMQKTATGYIMDTECGTPGMTMKSHTEITGDFNSAYTIKMTSQHLANGVSRDTNITVEAKWVGACAADQKAGDMIMPGGAKMNVKDLEEAARNMKNNMMKKQ